MIALLLLACNDDGGPAGKDAPTVPTTVPTTTVPTTSDCVPTGAAEAPLRKLTNTELDHTLGDLLGVDGTARDRLPPDGTVHGFENAAATVNVSQLAADGLMRVSEDATADADWTALLPCDAATGDRACAQTFVDDFGARAFRRPLEPEERDVLLGLYDAMIGVEGFSSTMALVVQAVLQSPQFLYRIELGEPGATGEVVPLTDHELATRLSYLLWETTPDDALLAEADAGTLRDGLDAQIDRLLADPRARRTVSHMAEQWLQITNLQDLPKDGLSYPSWSPELALDLREETRRFVEHEVFDGDGTLEALLLSRTAFVDGPVAEVYGVQGPPSPDQWVEVQLPADERAGLLTRAALLADAAHADQTSVVHRGKLVYEQLFCGIQPAPPGDLNITLPPLDDDLSTRERYARHIQDPACSGCHLNMDPVGLGFEHYDAVGAWRDTEGNGLPIDASGVVHYGTARGPFDGALELSEKAAGASDVSDCYVTQWVRYGFGRDPATSEACEIDALRASFAADGDILGLLSALPRTEAFATRPAVVP
ncbi:MAG: DUF1592 domain-containing protein [Alphaproteobacteria bacterium]|nr:DUF1592 domain-containing protein [Alphaproteobacteria bacterium]